MAEFSVESIPQISRLATNSLRIETGNLVGVSGNFRGGTGKFPSLLLRPRNSRVTGQARIRITGAMDAEGPDPPGWNFRQAQVENWSLTTLREKLFKIGAKGVRQITRIRPSDASRGKHSIGGRIWVTLPRKPSYLGYIARVLSHHSAGGPV